MARKLIVEIIGTQKAWMCKSTIEAPPADTIGSPDPPADSEGDDE